MAIALAVLTACTAPANAQFLEDFEETLWGVQASFTPEWNALQRLGPLIQADAVSLQGSEYTVGFARGRMSGGHWGLSLVRQRLQDGAICVPDQPECIQVTDAARLQGFAFNWFLPFGSRFAGDRLQMGMHVDAGAGWYEGPLRVGESEVDAGEYLQISGVGGPDLPLPILRAEFAAAVTLAPGLKVIGSGGYGLPGNRRVAVSVAYFPLAGR